MILKLEAITKEREMHMEKLWREFQKVLNSYLKYTEEYRDEYIDLRNRDAEDTRSIQDHYNGSYWCFMKKSLIRHIIFLKRFQN